MQAKSDSNIWGIDVSHWQGLIDWQQVAEAGVGFAYVKATDGVGNIDEQFRRNAGGANAVGIPVGAYHYARLSTNYVDEVDNFCRAISGLSFDLPLVLDLEDEKAVNGILTKNNGDKLKTSQQISIWAIRWLEEVKKRTGKKVMLYTGAGFINEWLAPELKVYDLWVAHYGVDKPMDNYIWDQWSVFQYSQSGSCQGISGEVDMNVAEVDWLEQFTGPKPLTNFVDVPAGDMFEKAIKAVSDAGIMNGVGNNLFGYGQPVTREQLASVVNDLLYLINQKADK